jgi:hypothetical protein
MYRAATMRIHAYTGVEEWQYVVDVAAKLTQSGG